MKKDAPQQVRVALSLGPYGAQFGQEYSGYYPPPFGPEGPNSEGIAYTNVFPANELEKEEEAKEALTTFHYERLLVFARDPTIWSMVDCLAFETIPLLREAQAIQKAVLRLEKYLEENGSEMKPWWLTFVFFKGQFPQDARYGAQRKLSVSEIIRGLCSPIGLGILPDGIGVNCTRPEDAIRMTKCFIAELKHYSIPLPWLVLYPNGGHGYDLASHAWVDQDVSESEASARYKWIQSVETFCAEQGRLSRGLLVGGCCKCGPEYVNDLKRSIVSTKFE